MARKEQKRRIADVEFGSFIADGSEVRGAYRGKTNLLIAGAVRGDVEIDGTVMVMTPAAVDGTVAAVNVVVSGRVDGDVRARKVAEIRRKAIIAGSVVAREVYVAVGAQVGGEIIAHGKKGVTSFREQRHAASAPPSSSK
ncbi:MAG: polymer-forming cytoskeletal protein [Candidatus Coatesbacteria bacterium]|nr:MAG: polymer-forming cytoskeletal protein [Candidatus Coatesbacteria bacterium]